MMKLGTETGSVINHVMSRGAVVEPQLGMAATILMWSDRYPGTVNEVTLAKGKVAAFTVREDTATRVDTNGMSESQKYDYSPNPEGRVHRFKLDRQGKWRSTYTNENGRQVMAKGGTGVVLGFRQKYHDFSF